MRSSGTRTEQSSLGAFRCERKPFRGWRLELHLFGFNFSLEGEWYKRNEWGFYVWLDRRGRDWLRINVGPGVIPF